MLSRAHRLTANKDFQNVYRRGRYNATAFLSVNILENKYGATKIGVVVSKKVAKKAHDRNLIKRRVREAARIVYSKLKPGYSIVISAKAGSAGKDYKALEKDLLGSFKRLGAFRNEDPKNNN